MTVKKEYKVGDKVRVVLPKTPENHKAYLYPPDVLFQCSLKVGDVCTIEDTGWDDEYHRPSRRTYRLCKYSEDNKLITSWWVTADAIAFSYVIEEESDDD